MRIEGEEFGPIAVYASTSEPGQTRPVLLWHHGSPQTGEVIGSVRAAADAAGLDVVSIARPGYGGSERRIGRDCRSVGVDAQRVLDVLGIDAVVTAGASGGGPHALASAAVLGDRVTAVVTLASLAPYSGDAQWFAGMIDPTALRAAARGVEARTDHLAHESFDPETFTEGDYEVLASSWRELGEDVAAADEWGPWGLVDDDVAFTRPWGFTLDEVEAPVQVLHGDADRVVPAHHATALAAALPEARLVRRADAGHIAILAELSAALRALR